MIDYIFGGIVDVHNSSPSFKLKQYDNNSHKLHMTIVDNDNPYGSTVNLDGHSVRAYFKLPDGSDEYVDCELIKPKSGKIAVPFPSSVTQQVGIVKCEIRISDGNNLISLNVFTFEIVESIYNSSAIESTEKYSALDRALIEVQSVRNEVNALAALADNGEIPAGTIEAEVVDARVDSTGQVYANLGEAVRSMQSGYRQIDFGWEFGTVDQNGNEAPATSLKRSAFLPADLLRGVTLNIDSEDPLSSGERVNDWFYNENKTFIGRGSAYTATAKISIPSEAVYVRFVAAAATPDKVSAAVLARQYDAELNNQIADVRQGVEDAEERLEEVEGCLEDVEERVDGVETLISDVSTASLNVEERLNKLGTIDFGWESGALNYTDGSEAENNNYVRSSFIPTKGLSKWKLVIDGVLTNENRINTVWYTGAKTYYARGGSYTETTDNITVSDNAKFIRFVIKKEVVDLVKLDPKTEERLEGVEERLEGVESVISDVSTASLNVEERLEGVESVISDVSTASLNVEERLEGVESVISDVSVASLNRDKEHLLYSAWQSCAPRLQGSSLDDGDGTALGFLHFSDVHGTLISWKRLGAYLDRFSDLFSFALHTGDYVPSSQSDYNSNSGNMYQRVATEKPILNCVGNHDTLLSGSTKNPDPSAARGILFADIANWGVTRPSDEVMYYYKDFGDVRLIVLDQYYTDATETAWLTDLLTDARTNGKSVITATHTQTAPITHNISTFNDIDRPSSALPETNGFENAIKTFKDAGGTHICHLGGHWHWDVVGTTDNGILNILVECATIYGGGYRNDVRRYGDKSEGQSRAYDCFNAVFVDTFTHTIRIIRIGSNTDNYLHPKNTLCIDYAAGTLIANG